MERDEKTNSCCERGRKAAHDRIDEREMFCLEYSSLSQYIVIVRRAERLDDMETRKVNFRPRKLINKIKQKDQAKNHRNRRSINWPTVWK